MKNTQKEQQNRRFRRARSTRARLHGTKERPRMSVQRSLRHIRVQLINDDLGVTVVSASDAELNDKISKTEQASKVGELVADKAKAAGIQTVVFDRGSYKYHGRVKAVADAARAGGLMF